MGIIQMGKLTRAIRQLQSVQLGGDPEQSGYCDLKLDVMDMYFASLAVVCMGHFLGAFFFTTK